MPKIFNRALMIGGEPGASGITVLEYDANAMIVRAKGATVPTATTAGYAVGCVFIDTTSGAGVTFYVNEGSTTSCAFNVAAGEASAATAYDDIGNPDASGSIAMGAYTGTYTSATVNWGGVIMSNTHANPTAGANLLTLGYTADGDAHGIFLVCLDNSSADTMFQIAANGATTIAGNATGTDALTITAGDITLTSGDLDLTAGAVLISADNQKIAFGAGGSDSYILFNGTSMVFYDTNVASAVTLAQLLSGTTLNPTVTGDLTIADGKFNWTNGTDEVAGAWSFSSAGAGSDIDITTVADTGECIHIVANSITTGQVLDIETDSIGAAGALVYLDITAGAHNATGNFVQCFNGTADVFEVGLYGAVTIGGNASTDVLTITAGDLQITAGDIDLDLGIIAVDNTADESNYIKRNFNGAGTAAVLQLQNSHASGTNDVLFINQDGTGAATAMQIDSEGTADTLTITGKATAASLIKATAEIATGTVLEVISAASSTVSALTFASSGTGATGWLGATGVGMLNITADGNLAHANASCLLIAYSGAGAATGMGTSLRIVDTGATATSYAVYISAATGEAIKVDAGKVVVDETLQAAGGIITLYNGAIDLTATPTNAEFDTALGANATAGTIAVVKDLGGTPVYLVASDGADNWYIALTKAL